MPISYERKEIRQRGSEGFTDEEKIADVGLVDLIWNVEKVEPWRACSVTLLQRNVRTRRLICLLETASLAIGHSLGRSL